MILLYILGFLIVGYLLMQVAGIGYAIRIDEEKKENLKSGDIENLFPDFYKKIEDEFFQSKAKRIKRDNDNLVFIDADAEEMADSNYIIMFKRYTGYNQYGMRFAKYDWENERPFGEDYEFANHKELKVHQIPLMKTLFDVKFSESQKEN